MKACILTESHLKTVLLMAKGEPELKPVVPLLERALVEVEAVRRTQALLFRVGGSRAR